VLAAALVALASLAGCKKAASGPAGPGSSPPPADDKKQWTPQEISANPVGYLQWADRKLQVQIAQREQKRKSLGERLDKIKVRQSALADNIANATNYRNRIETAARRADDEDRLPFMVGGKSFDQDTAKAAMAALAQYVEDHKPLEADYEQAVSALEQMVSVLGSDLDKLGRAREKLALDIERVGLNQSMADLDQLRKTEEEIAGFDQALSKMTTDESLSIDRLPADDKASQKVDLEGLLKPK
jgi:chromosome segregation ATPase